jgi:hypothetical protein
MAEIEDKVIDNVEGISECMEALEGCPVEAINRFDWPVEAIGDNGDE